MLKIIGYEKKKKKKKREKNRVGEVHHLYR